MYSFSVINVIDTYVRPYRRHTAITKNCVLTIIMAVAILHHNYSYTLPVALTNTGSAVAFILKLATRQHVLVDIVAEL